MLFIGLVTSLPLAEQQHVCAVVHRQVEGARKLTRPRLLRTPTGGFCNPDGIPNDGPFFKVLEHIEEERHRTPGRPPPAFDWRRFLPDTNVLSELMKRDLEFDLIAPSAKAHGLILVTRNVKHFDHAAGRRVENGFE
ncbi:MAG: hypothetical protein M5U12_25485 [Verrucomicrobia bacterium]|nr:hypothetical protein [Bryobacteraceae bacterium]MCZ7639108.1 hypothetical protein [Verrucomicrobiota bacterium]